MGGTGVGVGSSMLGGCSLDQACNVLPLDFSARETSILTVEAPSSGLLLLGPEVSRRPQADKTRVCPRGLC